MIHQELLRRAVPEDDKVMTDFVEALVPKILMHLASVPALGGSGKPPVIEGLEIPDGLHTYTAQDYARLTRSGRQEDQSMATHLLNGLFVAMRLAQKLPANKQMNDIEQRLWILGYLCHDYTKIYGVQISAGEIPLIKQLIERLGEVMNFGAFLVDWREYLGDIAFLAQNTQTKEGSNLQATLFQTKSDLRRLEILRLLSSIADVLVHIKSPAEVAIALERSTNQNIYEKMIVLFGAERVPHFTYHRLTEVRGLLSNIINNAVMQAMTEQGAEPFLFFPNGVVYLLLENRKEIEAINDLPDRAWKVVRDLLLYGENKAESGLDAEDLEEESDEDLSRGLGIRPRRGLKVPAILYEILSLPQLLSEGKNAALNIKGTMAVDRFVSQKDSVKSSYLQSFKGKQKEETKGALTRQCETEYQIVLDNRTDQIAEFLAFIWRRVLNEMFTNIDKTLSKNLGTNKKVSTKLPKGYYTAQLVLDWLGFSGIAPEEAAFQKGKRIPTGWYCVAASYLQQFSTLNTEDISRLFDALIEKLLHYVQEKGLRPKATAVFETAFLEYVTNSLEIGGKRLANGLFAKEIGNYIERKNDNKLSCSLCSSPFESSEQREDAVLFKGQQYSNKGKLGVSQVKRGICPVCTVEMLLRIVQQSAPSTKFQDQKPVYFWIYPTYFFTTETARIVRQYIRELRDLFIPELRQHLQKNGFTISSLLNFEGFLVQKNEDHAWSIIRQKYDENYMAGLFSFAIKPLGKDPTDTDAWIVPAFHALALPLLLNVKVVATTSFVPLFASGAEFPETAVLDAPHQFTRYALGKDRFRVDELSDAVIRLLRLYDLHLDVFGDGKNSHWAQINEVVASITTDPLNVFMYYDRKKRGGGKEKKGKGKKDKGGSKSKQTISISDVNRYHQIYLTLGGEANMGVIGKLVDAYAAFYRTRGYNPSAYAIVRPLDELISGALKSEPKLERDDLLIVLSGPLADVMERVWQDSIKDATDPIIFEKNSARKMEERKMLSRQKQEEFVRLFLREFFDGLCQGRRATLQENANRYRSAAKFYYLKNYHYSNKSEANHE
jgi:CRISPR-associated protein Csc3